MDTVAKKKSFPRPCQETNINRSGTLS